MSKSKVSVTRRQEDLKKKRKIERKAQVAKKVTMERSRGQAQRTAAKQTKQAAKRKRIRERANRRSRRRLSAQKECLQQEVQETATKVNSMVFYELVRTRLAGRLGELMNTFHPEYRDRVYSPSVTLAMFLGQVLSEDGSCQNAIAQANVSRLATGRPKASQKNGAYCEARLRLSADLVQLLSNETAAGVNENTPASWLWRGRHLKLVDGSTIAMPDTEKNQAKYPQHGGQDEGAGNPIARLTAVISLANGSVMDIQMGAYKGKGTGELSLFAKQMDCFVNGDVQVSDALYCSYFVMAKQLEKGVDFVFEQHGARNTDFRRGQKLGKRDHLVILKKPAKRPAEMTQEEYDSCPDEITVRETRVRNKIIVSSFLNPREVNRRELGRVFLMRWNVELDIRNIKTTLGMEKLSCKTPEMCEKELRVYMLAYNLIRLLMAEGAMQADKNPRKLSFKNTVQVWRSLLQNPEINESSEALLELFMLVAEIQVGNRPGRIEPRAIKQRPKPFPRLKTTRRRARAAVQRRGHGKKLQVA
jgi:Transposase DDE domain